MLDLPKQRSNRADLKSQVAAVLLLLAVGGTASAATGASICQSDDCVNQIRVVDYEAKSRSVRDLKAEKESLKDTEDLASSTIPLTADKDTSVRRDIFLQSDLDLPKVEESVDGEKPDPVARLLERRLLQRDQEKAGDDQNLMKSALPGLEAEEVRIFKRKMHRTDI